MGAPHCRACNEWHYDEPINPCPAMENGFVRPFEAVNPYVGTVLEKWFRPVDRTVEQRRAWAELVGREYVEPPKPPVKPVSNRQSNKSPVLSNTESNKTESLSNSLTAESNKSFDKKQYQKDYMAKKRLKKGG